MDLRTSSKQYK